jgi:putative oxidoreductase
MLALGLFTRPCAAAAAALLLIGCVWHIQMGHRWFWNQQGIEFPLMWALAALFFAVNGGGPISLDLLLFGKTF